MRRSGILCGLALLLAASPAAAITVNPNMVEIAPPASTLQNVLQSDTQIVLFAESNGPLATALSVDVTAPGTYQNGSAPTAGSGSIAAGTEVTSYFIHFDAANGTQTATGSVTFDTDILGVIVYASGLDASNGLGHSGTAYFAAGNPNHGLEFGPSEDAVTLSANLRTLTLSLREQQNRVDQLRVIVASSALIPEPDTALLFGGGLLALAALRRRLR